MIEFFVMIARFFAALWRSIKREPQARAVFIFVIIMLVSGTIFFAEVEHWHWVDALWYCVMTLATVGTGDLTPHTDFGKLFSIVYIFMGIGTFLAAVRIIAQHALDQSEESPFEKLRAKFAKKKPQE